MPRKTVEGPQTVKKVLPRSPELHDLSRKLAVLALAQVDQEGHLGVRQREQLRRALATAGEALGWAGRVAAIEDAIAEVSKDVLTMTKGGAKSLAKDLEVELASKKTEMSQIRKAAAAATRMAESKKTTYPTEITYAFTARDATGDLVTKIETLPMENAEDALSAVATIEKNPTGRTKLRDLMITDLKQKRKQVEVMTKTLPDFLEYSHDLLRDVLHNLQ